MEGRRWLSSPGRRRRCLTCLRPGERPMRPGGVANCVGETAGRVGRHGRGRRDKGGYRAWLI